jgi:ankyrin repeat protein
MLDTHPASQLYIAIWRNRAEEAAALVSAGADPTHVYANDRTLLHTAAWFGHAALIPLILGWGVPIDARDHEGNTALRLAARNGKATVVHLLREAGAQADLPNHAGATLLHEAAAAGNTPLVLSLLTQGADIEANDLGGHSPLHLAVRHDRKVTIQALHAKGANWHHPNAQGRTPLDLAEAINSAWGAAWRKRLADAPKAQGAGKTGQRDRVSGDLGIPAAS